MDDEHEIVNFGTVALELGYVTPAQLSKAVTMQVGEDLDGMPHRKIGEILLDLGYVNAAQIEEVLKSLRKARSG